MESKTNPAKLALLVGTRKGTITISGDADRERWDVGDLKCQGEDVFHLVYDARTGSTLAAINSEVWGPEMRISSDLGATWSSSDGQPRFVGSDGRTVGKIWHIKPGRERTPGVLFAGVDPAALFRSDDYGATWQEVVGLTSHPTREEWWGGLGGLCLHSIVLDPDDDARMWVGISAVGVMGTEDAGESWRLMNKGLRADYLPDHFPELGQCPHKVLTHPSRPRSLVTQTHCGVFRSENGGESWEDLSIGLPSRFGFVLGLHANDPDTYYVVPEDKVMEDGEIGGNVRYVTDAKFRVYRTRNGGRDWEALTNGLPQNHAYLHVMREGMATDSLNPCGIYVGTTSGQVYYSRDDGDSWRLLVDNLPPINSVEVAVVE